MPFDELTPEELAVQLAAEESKEQAYIDKLKLLGYAVDGSLSDWEKLCDDVILFGKNWKQFAKAQFDLGTDFIQFCKQGNYITI